MPITIGPTTPSQFPDILAFWHRATEVPSSTDDLPGLHELFGRDPEALLVAVDHDEIVGTMIATWDGWRAGFYRLGVLPDRRHQGIGRRLVEAGEERCRGLGARRISLFAVEAHEGAVGFWLALGYRRDVDDIRFTRDLLPPPSA